MLSNGTTTCEAKSGYGLTTESELKLLRVIARLQMEHQIEIAPTFMGAHEIPTEFRDRPDAYVALVCGEMIPAVARAGLAEWCDVFCEDGVFTPADAAAILTAARAAGMKLRIHADELGASGGSTVAAAMGARSADHLIFVDAAARRLWRRQAPWRLCCRPPPSTSSCGATLPPACSSTRASPSRWPATSTRRRLLAVDAVRDNPRLLRDGPDLRRSAGRRDLERRILARSTSHRRQPRARKADGCGHGRRAGDRADPRRGANGSIGDQEGTLHRGPPPNAHV